VAGGAGRVSHLDNVPTEVPMNAGAGFVVGVLGAGLARAGAVAWASTEQAPRKDEDGDPLPAGAVARLGTTRWRLPFEPRRIVPSPDGKLLAVLSDYFAVELLDAATGKRRRGQAADVLRGGYDQGRSMAIAQDWTRFAAIAAEATRGILIIRERANAESKVEIVYGKRHSYEPLLPEWAKGKSLFSTSSEQLTAAEFSADGK